MTGGIPLDESLSESSSHGMSEPVRRDRRSE